MVINTSKAPKAQYLCSVDVMNMIDICIAKKLVKYKKKDDVNSLDCKSTVVDPPESRLDKLKKQFNKLYMAQAEFNPYLANDEPF